MKYRTIALTTLFTALPFVTLHAQDEEDFQRLARRNMNQQEAILKKDSTYADTPLHGGVYLGTSSRGRILPNGFLNYKRGKWAITGDVVMDFSDVDTRREEEGIWESGAEKLTKSSIKNLKQHEDLTMRFNYSLTSKDVLSLDIFQKYYHDKVNVSSIQSSKTEQGEPNEAKYEDQERKVKDFNCGALLEHMHRFSKGSSLSSRVYFKYDNKPTDVMSDLWGEHSASVPSKEHQRYVSSDPKAQVIYLSPTWKGFHFGVREKVGVMNMRINDTASRFHYNVDQTLSSFDLSYNPGAISMNVQAGYETYHHNIVDHVNEDIRHTYHDWIYNATVSWKISQQHRLTARYDHNITRPTYTQLYPFAHIGSYIGSWVMGNSSLQPSKSDQVQGRYTLTTRPVTMNAIVTYRNIHDDITSISNYNEEVQRNVKTWVNDATYSTLKLALEGELRRGIFSMTMGVHAQHIKYSGDNVSTDKAWSYSAKIRPQVKLPKDWTASYVLLYNGREEHLYWYNRAYTYMALRLQKQLGDWAIYAFAQDLLRADHVKVQKKTDYSFTTANDYNARALIMGCSYRF